MILLLQLLDFYWTYGINRFGPRRVEAWLEKLNSHLLIGGWKSVSLVDVYGSPCFSLWLCGCNLQCPFCHNWQIARRLECRWASVDFIVETLERAIHLVDFLHITGGEPLLQWEALTQLFGRVRGLGLAVSLNTNCTLVRPLERLLEKRLVDHLATDLKVPFHVLVGLPRTAADRLWKLYLECLSLTAKHGVTVELRIPVPANIEGYLEELDKTLNVASERLRDTEWYIVVIPLLGPPHVSPRDKTWCEEHCNPPRTILDEVATVARGYTSKVHVSQLVQDLSE